MTSGILAMATAALLSSPQALSRAKDELAARLAHVHRDRPWPTR